MVAGHRDPYDELKDQDSKSARKRLAESYQAEGPAPESFETGTEWARNERFVAERAALFGEHSLTGRAVSCRLCGHQAAEFTAPIATAPLAYCHACLYRAAKGVGEDRAAAVEALRMLGELEFDSVPMLEAQLDTLHVNPEVPVSPEGIDELLTLRCDIPRRRYAWTLLLESAGFARDGLRTSRGTMIRARDGHLCLSLREKAVCEFLHQHHIAHDREPLYPPDPVFNVSGRRRADWILTDGTLVELWGMPKDPAYAAKMEEKRRLAARHGLRLVELTDAELVRLPQMFAPWLPAGANTSGWSWTPAVAAPVKEPKQKFAGDATGRNEYNTTLRKERLERCRDAVELQAAGVSRKEIGELLGASAEGVKVLLRDGKFFADPSSDPGRLETAELAAAARQDGQTRAQFGAEMGLGKAKATEAWRDADVIAQTTDRFLPPG